MRLNEFIDATLFEIALGVQRAKQRSKELMAVAPPIVDGKPVAEGATVTFDVELAVTEATGSSKGREGKSGLGVNISVLKAEIGGNDQSASMTSSTNHRTHRISFAVPIYYTAHFRKPDDLSDDLPHLVKAMDQENLPVPEIWRKPA